MARRCWLLTIRRPPGATTAAATAAAKCQVPSAKCDAVCCCVLLLTVSLVLVRGHVFVRLTLKQFLKVCAGAKIEAWKRPPSIISLPEQLVLKVDDSFAAAVADEEAHEGVASLFA